MSLYFHTFANFFNMSSKKSCFIDSWKILSAELVIKYFEKMSQTINYLRVSLFLILVRPFRSKVFFLVSSMVTELFVKMQVFRQLWLVKLQRVLICQMFLELHHQSYQQVCHIYFLQKLILLVPSVH